MTIAKTKSCKFSFYSISFAAGKKLTQKEFLLNFATPPPKKKICVTHFRASGYEISVTKLTYGWEP